MAGATSAIRIKGLKELNRAFTMADKETRSRLRESLKGVGEPVRVAAEGHALTEIRNIGAWASMRVGIGRSIVYVAPKKRATRQPSRKRRNLGTLLMERAMIPALEQNQETAVRLADEMLDKLGRDWEQV